MTQIKADTRTVLYGTEPDRIKPMGTHGYVLPEGADAESEVTVLRFLDRTVRLSVHVGITHVTGMQGNRVSRANAFLTQQQATALRDALTAAIGEEG